MGSDLGLTDEQLVSLAESGDQSRLQRGRADALAYADAITRTDSDVSDELFARLRRHFDDDTIVELTETIAWENASSKFNRALRIPSQGLWKRGPSGQAESGGE